MTRPRKSKGVHQSVKVLRTMMDKEVCLRAWVSGFLIGCGVREDLTDGLAARIVEECLYRDGQDDTP